MSRVPGTPRYAIRIALAGSIVLAGLAIVVIGRHEPPADRRVSVVAWSRSGKLLAAGTPSGDISVWVNGRTSNPLRFHSRHGELNDLQFSPDERLLAVANRDLATYSIEGIWRRVIRSDGENYGTVRFREDGRTVLVIRGTGVIETIDVESGKSLMAICCSTIYGEVALTRDDAMIVNAGHWPGLWATGSGKLVRRLTPSRSFMTFRPIGFDRDQATFLWDRRMAASIGGTLRLAR